MTLAPTPAMTVTDARRSAALKLIAPPLACAAADRIRPWAQDPRYWQYRCQPVLLLGGSREDNLFQIADLEAHLDLLASCGGNFLRNTMSDRDGGDEHAWQRLPDGRYDLTQWNPAYWQRFAHFLQLTAERDIIVQIEVWDRFDWSCQPWLAHPVNPANAASAQPREAGLAQVYPEHPGIDVQPFFHSVPGCTRYEPQLDPLRRLQEAFVDEMLRHSLPYGHVLYCMDNETSSAPAWGQYWMAHIRRRAVEASVQVCVTDMFDDAWKPQESPSFAGVLASPQVYDFVEISQVNSRNFGAEHWQRIVWVCQQAHANEPRPVNHTKIYSDGCTSFGSGTPQDGIERFWRNLLAGSAAVRFHRPTSGLGLSPLAQACMRSARLVHRVMPFWSLRPDEALAPGGVEANRAYAARDPQHRVVVFLPRGQPQELAWPQAGAVHVDWIAIATGARVGAQTIQAKGVIQLQPPLSGPCVAMVRRV
ncbi:MAG: hypothetical protein WD042_09985 [Phycisphaeraceae bacterium]